MRIKNCKDRMIPILRKYPGIMLACNTYIEVIIQEIEHKLEIGTPEALEIADELKAEFLDELDELLKMDDLDIKQSTRDYILYSWRLK